MSKRQCPLDKTCFASSCETTIDDFRTNYLAMHLLSDRAWSQCPLHHEKRKIVCLTDKALVCSSCVIFGDHKDHEVKPASDFQSVFERKEARLRALAGRIDKTTTSFPLSLEQTAKSMKNMVEERFRILRFLLENEELSIKRQIDDAYSNEKLRFEKMMPEISDLQTVIQEKLIESRVILPDSSMEQDITDLEERVGRKLIQMTEISEKFQSWQKTLRSTFLIAKKNVSELIALPMTPHWEKLGNDLGIEKLELGAQVTALLKFEQEKQTHFLGESLYPLVSEIVGDKYAPKVTGMMIDLSVLELNEILEYLYDAKSLKDGVDEAMELLREEELVELPSSEIHVIPQHDERSENEIEIAV